MGEYLTVTNGIILYFCLAVPVAFIIALRNVRRQRRIVRDGAQVGARVAQLRDLGGRVNDAVVAELILDIERPEPGPAARRVSTRFTVPPLAVPRFQPGCEVALRVDPDDPNRVCVDRAAMGV